MRNTFLLGCMLLLAESAWAGQSVFTEPQSAPAWVWQVPAEQGLRSLQIDARVTSLMRQADVPGLAMVLIRDGQPVYRHAYGYADVAAQKLLSTGSVMSGASLTKAAFAYLVMQLVDEGAIDLDAPLPVQLKKPLPDYAGYSDLAGDPRWRQVTPRMLLSHSSGLLNWRRINDDRKLDFKYAPGSRYVYSGEGMQIMQLIVEERTGQSVGQLMQVRVFDRFGMKNTSMTWRADYEGRQSNGHDAQGRLVPHARRTRVSAAGSMDTTADDYALFLAGVLRGEGLSPQAHSAMLGPQIAIVSPQQFPSHFPGETHVNDAIQLAYGLGWATYQSPLGLAFFKEGNDDGTNNFALGFAQSRDGMVLLSNSARADRIFFPLVQSLFGRTCLPWFWMGYIPYNQEALRKPEAREHPFSTCL
jgi:CubicO group peptidase (beta-lactamase class C family)